jgi:ABC-type siderophore export system fused ATPase/permease subunit
VSAALSAGFVATIHRALGTRDPDSVLLVAFVGFGAGRILVAYFAGTLIGSHAQEAIAKLRRRLIQQLLTVPYLRVERAGLAKAQVALTHDMHIQLIQVKAERPE